MMPREKLTGVRQSVALFLTCVLCAFVGISMTPVPVDAQQNGLLRVEYRVTLVMKDGNTEPALKEEGTILIDRQGRYRIDRRRGGSWTVEIVDHVRRQRMSLDMDRKLFVTRSGESLQAGPPTLPSGPVVVESLAASATAKGESIGSKVVGDGHVLEGVRFRIPIEQGGDHVMLTMENWYLPFPDRGHAPVALETRFEDAKSVTTKEVHTLLEVPMNERAFTVPAGFRQVRSGGEDRRDQ